MPISQILLASRAGGGAPPTPTYTFTPQTVSADEGSAFTFEIGGTNIVNGTYYWTIETGSSEFTTTSGSFTITNNYGVIIVTPTADVTTEGAETFTVSIRSDSITGTVLATSSTITINDSSLTPLVPPFSLDFPAGNPYLLVSNTQSDWALGNTYTIEYWSKSASPSFPSAIRTVMSQGPDSGKIDLGYFFGGLLWSNAQIQYAEPSVGGVPTTVFNISSPGGWNGVGTPSSWTNLATTGGTGTGLRISVAGAQGGYANAVGIVTPGSGYTSGDVITAVGESSVSFTIGNCSARGIWTHVAFVRNGSGPNTKLYYNGVFQTEFNGSSLNDGSTDLNIGRRAGVNGQGFLGKLAMIRISNTAKYLDNFSPSLSYGREADTRMMLGSDNPLTDLALYELNGITASVAGGIGNNGVLYFSKATYPDLNNQVRAGDTVVDATTAATSTVIGAVFTADPDNWGITISSIQQVGTKNFSGPGRHPISVQGAVTASMDFPNFQSLEFVENQGDFLDVAGSSDFNLGTTWTIEFWLKANAASQTAGGGIWGLLNQVGWSTTNNIVVALSDNKLVFLSVAESANADVRYTEPTVGQWTHVAIVNNAGTQRVWYNGVEQTKVSGTFGTADYTNGTADVRIGRLGPQNGGTLNGKMAMVRISSNVRYTEAFTPTTTYGVDGYTRLFLSKVNPTVDSKNHRILNNGVALSSDFPT
jgi:hypothetical protein